MSGGSDDYPVTSTPPPEQQPVGGMGDHAGDGGDGQERENEAKTEVSAGKAVERQLQPKQMDELLIWQRGLGDEYLRHTTSSGKANMIRAVVATEMAARDNERARRYVATVKPAMTALRYPGTDEREDEQGGRLRKTEEGEERRATAATAMVTTPTATVPTTPMTPPPMETTMTLETTGYDMMLGHQPVPDRANVAAVRLARKQEKREAKRQRVEKAVKRAMATPTVGDEIERVVIGLDDERRARRQQQAEAALDELAKRNQQRWTQTQTQHQREQQSARVSLVQRRGKAAVNVARGSGVQADDGLPTAVMELDGEKHDVKLDSCARYSVAGMDWMERGERVPGPAPVDYVEGVGGFLLDVVGVWAFEMRNVYGQVVRVTACIIEGCTNEFLVGVDFMKKHRANMDFARNEIRFYDKELLVVIPFRTEDGKGGEAKVAAVRLVRRVKLTRTAVTPVTIMVAAPDGEQGIFVPTQNGGAVMLATTVTRVMDGKAIVPAINLRSDRVKLPGKKELGVWIPLAADMDVLEMDGELATDKVDEWLKSLGDIKTPLDNEDEVRIGEKDANTRAKVIKLLRAYREVSVDTGDCPPMTVLDVQHHIDTGNAAPIMMKRRRQAQTEDVVTDDNVTKMLGAGVIEEGNGAWGFPVVLVRKKDGEVRFCIDYRALNKITKRDVYPLPRIDETLDALRGAQLFTTLDLRAGYWQIGVAPEDRDKTAFTTKRGLYRFKRMPFGLMNAPSTFQRMMNGVLRGLTWTTCLVYLDDIVVFTRGGIERHLVQLATVLQRLSTAGLTLKLKKCMFATRTMEYLGHELSNEGVRPVQRLISAVAEFPRPRDPVETKRFVHLAGYYRKFIEAFGSIMAPMTRLLKKDCAWEWTEDQQFAFERVKAVLTTKPLLIYPDFTLPFRLVTDASKVGFGACLMQDQGRGWQPTAYASKVNSNAESNYSITELECLSVIWSVKLFRPYLYGRTFEIVTDHAALKWLMTRPNLAGRLHRWSLTLQEYEFEILYRPGTMNVVADALSRAPTATTAALRAVKRGKRKRNWRQEQRPAIDVETEAKTEDDDLPTEADKQEAEAAAIRTAATTPTAVKVAAIPMSQTTATFGRTETAVAPTAVATMVIRERPERSPQTETRRPQTRLAKKRTKETTMNQVEMPTATLGDDGTTTLNDDSQKEAFRTTSDPRMTLARGTRQDGRTTRSVTWAEPLNNETAARQTGRAARTVTETTKRVSRWEALRNTPPESREVSSRWTTDTITTPANNTAMTKAKPKPTRPKRTVPTGPEERPATSKDDSAIDRTRTAWKTSRSSLKDTGTIDAQKKLGKAKPRDNVSSVSETEDDRMGDDVAHADNTTLQLMDDEIAAAQRRSRLVKTMLNNGQYRGMKVECVFGLVVIGTARGRRVVLPPTLWAVVFKEMHGSIWAGHLRVPHTYGRVSQLYWWPRLYDEVKHWVRGCQECGSRKAKPREVIPPLRSLHGGDVGDRWALDVAGPFPIAGGGERYVIAALEYVTRYAVARSVVQHTAERVATFLMEDVVLKYGAFRELLTDGAPEMTGRVIEQLVVLLQAKQTNPVPYRPQMIGLVERFHRTWKDCVATFMADERQNDWSDWVQCAVFAYNSAQHSTVALSPNELMLGRKLRPPNELLRATEPTVAGELLDYHRRLIAALNRGRECADRAREKEQARQAHYYDKKAKQRRTFVAGDRVWVYNPPRGPKATKFVHQWMGPMEVVEPAGFENYLLKREDKTGEPELMVAHVSFMISYHSPTSLLRRMADDLVEQLEYEDLGARAVNEQTAGAPVLATSAGGRGATANGNRKRRRKTANDQNGKDNNHLKLVERRRRKRRNTAGQYVIDYELQPTGSGWTRTADGGRWTTKCGTPTARWVRRDEYERLHQCGRVVEDPEFEEVV